MEFANNPEELNELEAKYVTLTEIYDPQCYNLKTGGNQNSIVSEVVRQKISLSNKGKPKTEEHRKHVSEATKLAMSREDVKQHLKIANISRWTDELRKRQSEYLTANNPMKRYELRKRQSDIMKNKTGFTKGRIWVNNGEYRKCVFPNNIPYGFKKGYKICK